MNHLKKYLIATIASFCLLCIAGNGNFYGNSRLHENTSESFFSLAPPFSHASAGPSNTLSPVDEHSLLCIEILNQLRHKHYRKMELNDELSHKMFDLYLTELDEARMFFLDKDIQNFEPLRYLLDEALRIGELEPAFFIYNRFQERLQERLLYLTDFINNKFDTLDFSISESIQIERKNAPWAKSVEELNNLWRKRLKNDVLNLKMAGKPMKDIPELLGKRYRNQLNRVKQTKSEDVFRGFMNALTKNFDPHTLYFSPRLLENFNIQMRLSLEGIGAVLQTESEYTKVVRLIPAGPADKSKQLKPGDLIVGVGQGLDGEMVDVIGWRIDDVVELIRGPKKTLVRLEIIPVDKKDEHQTKTINITRNTVKLEEQAAKKKLIEMEYKGKSMKIGIIDIPAFYVDFQALREGKKDYKSTVRDVRRLLEELKKEKVDGLIVDLRDNSGGSLREVNELIGLFIEIGPVVQVRGEGRGVTQLNDMDPEMVYHGPLAVMINRLSASASEIFAGAIQDYQRGIIIGSRTFGKGTVQTLLRLQQGELKLTTAKFYRISGESTQHQGVIPDIVFPSIYDNEEIGESALTNVLPWDKIRPANFEPYPNLKTKIARLKVLHANNIKKSPDFSFLVEEIEYLNELRQRTELSLQEKTRNMEREVSEQRRLKMENKRRKAKGLEPIEKFSELEKEKEKEKKEGEAGEKELPDPFLVESQNILLDFIHLSQDQLVWN